MMNKKLHNKYNTPDTVGIISSYPAQGGEIAMANAISRYTYLLSKSFPKNQKIIIFCEKDKDSVSYEVGSNILIVPTYKYNSILLFKDILKNMSMFSEIKDVLIQFEFSIFGGKKVIPSVLMLLFFLKLLRRNVSFMFHQVVTNLSELSGHLGISQKSFKTSILNIFLKSFYFLVGILTNKVLVHENLFKDRLSEFVNLDKIEVIPHAIGDEKVKTITKKHKVATRKEFGFKTNDKVLTVFGYRSWYKGTDWIVKTVKKIADTNPKMNIKLLVAGGVSPTLKNTASYKCFDQKLKRVIKNANGSVKVTGFIPERNVWKVFAASDLMVFPYRTKMSVSGAFSLTLAYKKPFIVSKNFAVGTDINKNNIFDLNAFSFQKALTNVVSKKHKKRDYVGIGWSEVSNLYLSKVKSEIKLPRFTLFPRFALTK